MPAAAAAIPLITTAVSAGTSLYGMSQANKRAKEAQNAIDNYERQDLINPAQSLQVSTLGADRQREDLNRLVATLANNSLGGGTRALMALAPQLIAQQNQQSQQISNNLDQQEMQRQQMIAQGNANVQNQTEVRENNELIGMGNLFNVARTEGMNAQNNLMQTAVSAGSLAGEFAKQGLFNGLGNFAGLNPFRRNVLTPITGTQVGLNVDSYNTTPNAINIPNLNPKL